MCTPWHEAVQGRTGSRGKVCRSGTAGERSIKKLYMACTPLQHGPSRQKSRAVHLRMACRFGRSCRQAYRAGQMCQCHGFDRNWGIRLYWPLHRQLRKCIQHMLQASYHPSWPQSRRSWGFCLRHRTLRNVTRFQPRCAETDTALAYGKRGADAGQLAEEAFFLPPKQVASVCAPLPVCQGRVRLCRPRTCGRATQQARDCVSSVVATRRVVCEILSYEIGPRTSGV